MPHPPGAGDGDRVLPVELGVVPVQVFITTSRFSTAPQYSNSATFELAYSTDSTDELLGWAFKGLEEIYRPGYWYKKAGIMLNRLAPADGLSMRLFGDERFERSRRVMKAVDDINRKFGV